MNTETEMEVKPQLTIRIPTVHVPHPPPLQVPVESDRIRPGWSKILGVVPTPPGGDIDDLSEKLVEIDLGEDEDDADVGGGDPKKGGGHMTGGRAAGLSNRLLQLNRDGRTLVDDSTQSEATLKAAMSDVLAFARSEVEKLGGVVEHVSSISLADCQKMFHEAGGPEPVGVGDNSKVSMRPDGGIIMATIDGKKYPLFIGEDKVQGTNDSRLASGLPRQSTGNAIERAAKNIRGCEMITAHMSVFPYVVFASGCDFHDSETISKRLVMMNMGRPNHYLEVGPEAPPVPRQMEGVIGSINIDKLMGHGLASIFVKAHKYDKMPHGASRWTRPELVSIATRVVTLALRSVTKGR
jgi:hypothetical protein